MRGAETDGGAAGVKVKFGKIRLPKKVMFILAGVLLLGGASGAFALYAARSSHSEEAGKKEVSLSGEACTTIRTLKLRRNGQRWIRKYVNTESVGGVERVRTALRVTGVLAKQEKADFYHVVVLDQGGPTDRAQIRGAAIGAEVLFAPQPEKIPGMTAAFIAKYNDANANMAGLFHGKEIVMPMTEIQAALTAMDDKSDCVDPTVVVGAEGSEIAAAHKSMPGDEEVSGGHAPAGAHGAEDAEGAAESEGHGEPAAEGAHGEPAAENAHGAEEPAEETGGMFASIKSMIFGAEDAPAEATPAGHDAAEPAEAEGHATATEPAADEGMLSSLKNMIFGGETETPAADHEAAPPPAETSHEEALPAKAEEHAGADEHAVPEAPDHAAAEKPAAH